MGSVTSGTGVGGGYVVAMLAMRVIGPGYFYQAKHQE